MDQVVLRIDGKIVDLGDAEIPFESINPLFSENAFNSEYSFEHHLPFTPRNMSVLGFVNRYDTDKQSQLTYELSISGFSFYKGFVRISISDNSKFRLVYISSEIDFVQKASAKALKDLDFDTVTVCETGDSPETMLEKWKTYIENNMLVENPTVGTCKFPMIMTEGYDGNRGSENLIHFLNGHVVNPFALGEFQVGFKVEDSEKPTADAKFFPFTISPCPRVHHIIEKIMEMYNIRELVGDFWQNKEYQQMVAFSGIVMDYIRRGSETVFEEWDNVMNWWNIEVPVTYTYEWNVYGYQFNLKDFVPDNVVLSVFKMLFECFGVVFRFENGKLIANYADKLLIQKPSDYSHIYIDNGIYEQQLENVISIGYSRETDLKRTILPKWNYTSSVTNVFENDDSMLSISEGNAEQNVDYPLDHLPMRSTFFVTEGLHTQQTIWKTEADRDKTAFGEHAPRFLYNYGIASLGLQDKQYRRSDWNIGCYRGVHETIRTYFEGDDPAFASYDVPWPFSWSGCNWDSNTVSPPFNHQFGNSIYLNEQRGTYALYLRNKLLKSDNSDTITREANLELHKLMELKKFEDIVHFLKDRNGNRIGILAKISAVITSKGIKSVVLDYKIPKKLPIQGDFSNDFSKDYSI